MQNSNQTVTNLKVYSEVNLKKDPRLKLRYAKGLGDALACFLHSKPIGWLTHLITGKKMPCIKCWSRANALNVLAPIPFWKLFFKNTQEVSEAFKKDMEDNGFITKDNKMVRATSPEIPKNIINNNVPVINPPIYSNNNENNLENYNLITSGDNFVGEFMIRTQIYKKK
jgi:hypothetical protein